MGRHAPCWVNQLDSLARRGGPGVICNLQDSETGPPRSSLRKKLAATGPKSRPPPSAVGTLSGRPTHVPWVQSMLPGEGPDPCPLTHPIQSNHLGWPEAQARGSIQWPRGPNGGSGACPA